MTTHTFEFKDVDVDFAAGAAGFIDHTDRKRLDSYSGWLHYHLETWMNAVNGCTWDTAGFTPGSGWDDGTYNDVELRRADNFGSGRGLYATLVVSGGAVASVTITKSGNGFKSGDVVQIFQNGPTGTGSGFELTCTGGNPTIGHVHDVSEDTNTGTRDAKWMIGFDRGGEDGIGYEFANWIEYSKQASTTTTYFTISLYQPSGSGSYGTRTTQLQTNNSEWLSTTGSNYKVWVHYDHTPGREHFFYGDTQYANMAGFSLIQPDSFTEVVNKNVVSPWVAHYGYSNYYQVTNRLDSALVVRPVNYSLPYPDDYGCIFTSPSIRCRSVVLGSMNPICATTLTLAVSSVMGLVDIGDATRQYRVMTPRFMVEELL